MLRICGQVSSGSEAGTNGGITMDLAIYLVNPLERYKGKGKVVPVL
jgi:hypothetical protein